MHKYLDVETAMTSLAEFDHVYIVAESYLVVYALAEPWYSRALFLQELLVLRLPHARTSFGIVPSFLAAEAERAGAVLAAAGTALATSDAALARLYAQHGFAEQGRTLVKEIN